MRNKRKMQSVEKLSIEELEQRLCERIAKLKADEQAEVNRAALASFMPQVAHIKMNSRQIWLPSTSHETNCNPHLPPD